MRIPFFSWLFDTLIRKWEVKDTYEEMAKVDAILIFTIAQNKNGKAGGALLCILKKVLELFLSLKIEPKIIFSNRFTVVSRPDYSVANLIADYLKSLGVKNEYFVNPTGTENKNIRNTFKEAIYAIGECKRLKIKNITVVANHIHMRRCLAALRKAMKVTDYQVEIRTISVGQNSYGPNASCQNRFLHPYLFFSYEQIAHPVSRIKGWW